MNKNEKFELECNISDLNDELQSLREENKKLREALDTLMVYCRALKDNYQDGDVQFALEDFLEGLEKLEKTKK